MNSNLHCNYFPFKTFLFVFINNSRFIVNEARKKALLFYPAKPHCTAWKLFFLPFPSCLLLLMMFWMQCRRRIGVHTILNSFPCPLKWFFFWNVYKLFFYLLQSETKVKSSLCVQKILRVCIKFQYRLFKFKKFPFFCFSINWGSLGKTRHGMGMGFILRKFWWKMVTNCYFWCNL